MPKLLVLLAFLTLLALEVAFAQGLGIRQLPTKGERGFLGDPQPLPAVVIGGNILRLAPGGVIFDQQNRSIVHATLPPRADVFYTTNANGDIQRMYILTPDESALLDRSPRK